MEMKLLSNLLASPIRPETCKFIRYRYRGNEKAETTRRAYSNVFLIGRQQSKKILIFSQTASLYPLVYCFEIATNIPII